MIKHLKITLLVSVSFLGMLAPAFADDDDDVVVSQKQTIGFVDIIQILQQSEKAKKIAKDLVAKFKGRQEAIVKIRKQLQDATAKLERDGVIMNDNEKKSLRMSVDNTRTQLQTLQTKYVKDAQEAQAEAMKKFFKLVNGNIENVAQKQHISMVFHKNALAFADKSVVNITHDVLKSLED
jgi:outer membrane protein